MMLATGFADLAEGLRRFPLWRALAWADVRRSSQRTRLGVLLQSVGFFIVCAGLGFLYARILGRAPEVYVPWIAAGFLAWGYLSAPLSSGLVVIIANRGMLTQVPTPVSLYVLRGACRQAYILGLNLLGYYAVLLAFGIQPASQPLLMLAGFLLATISVVAWTMAASIAAVFQRWMLEIVPSVIRLAFFVTPIIWMPEMLHADGPDDGAYDSRLGRAAVLLNPFYHYVEVLRGPTIGAPTAVLSWTVVLVLTLVSIVLALVMLDRLKQRLLVSL